MSHKIFLRFFKITIIAITLSSLSACYGDRAQSEQLFKKYCNEEGRVGQFIYEQVLLGEEYFRPIPTDEKELSRLDKRFYIDDKKLLIDKHRFKQSYIFNDQVKTMLSPIGPIYSFETTIVRKSDGKVLSKAVSLLNMLDKSSEYFATEGETCPTGRDIQRNSLFNKNHHNIIEKTFSR
ncbi:MAG: hypothetical protein MJK15_13920 [Colwellia sp.]|nr:hypothetical protein [Colwellia sp.]